MAGPPRPQTHTAKKCFRNLQAQKGRCQSHPFQDMAMRIIAQQKKQQGGKAWTVDKLNKKVIFKQKNQGF